MHSLFVRFFHPVADLHVNIGRPERSIFCVAVYFISWLITSHILFINLDVPLTHFVAVKLFLFWPVKTFLFF